MSSASRERILDRVTRAVRGREQQDHPGSLATPELSEPVEAFTIRFERAGGEVARVDPGQDPGAWLSRYIATLGGSPSGVAIGPDVPDSLRPDLPSVAPKDADVGITLAWGGVAETGSLILPSTGHRATQLLPPVLITWLDPRLLFGRLEDALQALGADLPAAVGLHSAPSKSADIGRTLVTGVHGPGRCIAILHPVGRHTEPPVTTEAPEATVPPEPGAGTQPS